MGEAALVLLMGALYLGGLFLFFWLFVHVIEWPEKALRYLLSRRKRKQQPSKPPQHHHDGFDHPA